MLADYPILSIMLFTPLIGSVLVFIFGKKDIVAKILALVISIIPLILAVLILLDFDFSSQNYQFYEEYRWIKQIGANYIVGVDGLSMPLVFLTTLLTTLSIIFSWDNEYRSREFFSFLLLMDSVVLGVFISLDFFLFYIFWEVELVPMYFLIAIWGGPNKKYAALKFFLYTQAASLLVLFGILGLYFKADLHTFSMAAIAGATATSQFSTYFQKLVFLGFLIGFGVKLPMVPFHTWLPDAHVEAPTAGSVLLAGVLLKMGGYGLIRIAIDILPDGTDYFVPLIAVLGVVSMLYGAFVCLAQKDLKRMVAYSSVSHMGFVLLGVATWTSIGFSGAIFQMFAHGLITAVLFMMAGAIHHKAGTREIPALGGIASKMPIASAILVAGFLASLGLPGMVGFVAELSVFIGTYQAWRLWILIPILSVAITAGYYLFALQRAVFGPLNPQLEKAHDLDFYEILPLAILLFLIVLFGVYPRLMLDIIKTFVDGFPSLGGG